VIVGGPEAEKGGGEVEAGRDLVAGEEPGLAPEIGREKKKLQRRKRKPATNRRMESLRILRPKMEKMEMEPMGWRLQRRKGPGPRVDLVEDLGAATDAAQNPEIGADQDQNLEKDPNDPDPEIEDGDPGVGREEGAEVNQDVDHDLESTRARRAREIGGPLIGRRRGPGSRETMTRRRLATRIRRTRSTKLSIWRFLILPKYFISLQLSLDLSFL